MIKEIFAKHLPEQTEVEDGPELEDGPEEVEDLKQEQAIALKLDSIERLVSMGVIGPSQVLDALDFSSAFDLDVLKKWVANKQQTNKGEI